MPLPSAGEFGQAALLMLGVVAALLAGTLILLGLPVACPCCDRARRPAPRRADQRLTVEFPDTWPG